MRLALVCITTLLIKFECLMAQNVGIGTNNPQSLLHLRGAGSGNQLLLEQTGGAALRLSNEATTVGPYLGTTTRHNLSFVTSNFVRATLDTNGFLGIGQTAPKHPLHFSNVLGNKIALNGSGGNHFGIGLQPFMMQFYTATSSDDIAFGFGNSGSFTERMRILGSGTIGVGTPTPQTSALMDLSSTTKGLLPPRMTAQERIAIGSPAAGLMVFDLTYRRYFYYDGRDWVALEKANPDDVVTTQIPDGLTSNSQFGFASNIDSLWAISGAPGQNGIVGAAFIFQKINGIWTQTAQLQPDDGVVQAFGSSVSIKYPYALVGAPRHSLFAGCVYLFFHNGTSWIQQSKFFKPTGTTVFDYFGNSVDIGKNHFVVGCPGAQNGSFADGGLVYTYKRTGNTWAQEQTISFAGSSTSLLSNTSNLGTAVAIDSIVIVAGSPGYVGTTGTGGIVQYRYNGSSWVFVTIYIPPAPLISGYKTFVRKFGAAVDVHLSPSSAIDPLVIGIGAPETYIEGGNFQFTETGSAHLIITEPGGSGVDAELFDFVSNDNRVENADGTIFRDYSLTTGYRFGSSVAVYGSGDASFFPGKEVRIMVGSPGKKSNRGLVEFFSNRSQHDLDTGAPTGGGYTVPALYGKEEGKVNGGKFGTSVSLFKPSINLVGAPGTSGNLGEIYFEF